MGKAAENWEATQERPLSKKKKSQNVLLWIKLHKPDLGKKRTFPMVALSLLSSIWVPGWRDCTKEYLKLKNRCFFTFPVNVKVTEVSQNWHWWPHGSGLPAVAVLACVVLVACQPVVANIPLLVWSTEIINADISSISISKYAKYQLAFGSLIVTFTLAPWWGMSECKWWNTKGICGNHLGDSQNS